ncbi:homoserine O-succinyltransferase [Pantoea ananatis]|uniref:homoserine O-succinyltransferase n=1 Tax=Pantoea ananas TaxID=553 RepID=UPI00158B6E7B|nr:homoserine O-succinyltransferase [Pantoea ananatis]MBA4823464.1 homoserine O-succinyltransferase [Pantoea ananatis]QKV88031.1 homoserine O-succinyltransferase [Pantoea ananatis]
MPIYFHDELPSAKKIRNFHIKSFNDKELSVINQSSISLLILNLMPDKIETEYQILNLLSQLPTHIDIDFLRLDHIEHKNTSKLHINKFYLPFNLIKDNKYDGLIVTGAPLEVIDFEKIKFWDQLVKIINWAKNNVGSSLFICWAVQAALNILYDTPKKHRKNKLSGVFTHHLTDNEDGLVQGFDEVFYAIHSRYADYPVSYLKENTDLRVLAETVTHDAYFFSSYDKRFVFVTGHPEYDRLTLSNEYLRDTLRGLSPTLPENYFPNDDVLRNPHFTWRSHGVLVFSNWINFCLLQKISTK